MGKVSWKPGNMLYPLPAVLVSCGSPETNDANMLTVAWTGTVCTNPPMLTVSIRPERHSYDIICRDMQLTVNLTTVDMLRATDWCGVKSGRDFDKFRETGLTPLPGIANTNCMIAESPLSIECRVKEIMKLGSHDMFICEVVNIVVDDGLIDPETKVFDLEKAGLIAYSHGKYLSLGQVLGTFGFSVRKSKKVKS